MMHKINDDCLKVKKKDLSKLKPLINLKTRSFVSEKSRTFASILYVLNLLKRFWLNYIPSILRYTEATENYNSA